MKATLLQRPLPAAGWGIVAICGFVVLLLVVLVAMILLAIVLGLLGFAYLVGIDIIGGIVAILGASLAFAVAAGFVADALVGVALASLVMRGENTSRWRELGVLAVGAAVVVLLSSLPIVGGWVKLVVVVLGLGAILIAWRRPRGMDAVVAPGAVAASAGASDPGHVMGPPDGPRRSDAPRPPTRTVRRASGSPAAAVARPCCAIGHPVDAFAAPSGGPLSMTRFASADRDLKEVIDMTDTATPTYAPPKPDERLREFEPFIGTWDMQGRTLDSDVDNVTARATFEFLPGGFFVAQRFKADFDGMPIESLEIIGYDPETDTFPSTVYANMAATAPGLPLGARRRRCDDHDRRARRDVPWPLERQVVLRRLAPAPRSRRPGNVPYDVSGQRATSA